MMGFSRELPVWKFSQPPTSPPTKVSLTHPLTHTQRTTTPSRPCHPRTMVSCAKTSNLINKRRFTYLRSIPSGGGADLQDVRESPLNFRGQPSPRFPEKLRLLKWSPPKQKRCTSTFDGTSNTSPGLRHGSWSNG